MALLDVIGSGNIHRCRKIQPYEATTYSLQTDKLEQFAAISTAELTLAVDVAGEEDQKKRKQFSLLELPVDFSRESLAMVSVQLFLVISDCLIWLIPRSLIYKIKKNFECICLFDQCENQPKSEVGTNSSGQHTDNESNLQVPERVRFARY